MHYEKTIGKLSTKIVKISSKIGEIYIKIGEISIKNGNKFPGKGFLDNGEVRVRLYPDNINPQKASG